MVTKYLVIEIQTNADGTVGNIVTSHDTMEQAYSKFYDVLSAAAVSSVPRHAAVLLQNDGSLVTMNSFDHSADE